MQVYALSGLINFVSAFSMAIFVYRKKPNLKKYIYLNLSVAAWGLSYFLWQISSSAFWAGLFFKFVVASIIISPIIFLLFCYEFAEVNRYKYIFIFDIVMCFSLLSINTFTNLIVSRLDSILLFEYWPMAGPLLPLYFVYFIINLGLGYLVLLKKSARKKRSNWILAATVIGYLGAATNFFLWYGIKIPPIGNISATIYVFIMAYSIMRHRVLEVSFALSNIFSRILTVSFLAVIYWFISTSLNYYDFFKTPYIPSPK